MRNLLSFVFLVFVLDCCGHPRRESNPRSNEEACDSTKESIFHGSYKVTSPDTSEDGKGERVVAFSEEYAVFRVYREIGLEAFEYTGLDLGDYLGYGYPGEGGILGIYTVSEGKLSGLWMNVDGEKVFAEYSRGAARLKPSDRRFEGSWYVKGSHPDGSEPYEYPMTLMKEGDVYEAVAEFEAGDSAQGAGLAVDNVLVLGFDVGGTKILKILSLEGSSLEGKWAFTYIDEHTGEPVTVFGIERATRK